MPSPIRALSLMLGTCCLLLVVTPVVLGATSSYTGPICGDTVTETCPGEPFTGSTFTGAVCADSASSFSGRESFAGTHTPAACAALCADKAAMDYRPTGECLCYDNIAPDAAVSCDASIMRLYYHPPAAQASGYSKRQELAARRRALAEDTSLCPADLTACRVEGSHDGYECIDTQTELESCGGCRYGVFSAPSLAAHRALRRINMPPLVLQPAVDVQPAAVGVDCSDRTQFVPGLTCRSGACVPY